jgi:methyl-accepting chemotaxis protein
MVAKATGREADLGPSLDETQHLILKGMEPGRVAAMQILIYHTQTQADEKSDVTPEVFMKSVEDLRTAHRIMREIVSVRLHSFDIELPKELMAMHGDVESAVHDLLRLVDRCSVSEAGAIKGFAPTAKMYDLCCNRVAQGLSKYASALGAFFLELTEKGKADALDKTSMIASEIGKIGRVINMVATNASIEAARVGDAGKGFNVIADEVKALSSRVSSLSVSLTDRLN